MNLAQQALRPCSRPLKCSSTQQVVRYLPLSGLVSVALPVDSKLVLSILTNGVPALRVGKCPLRPIKLVSFGCKIDKLDLRLQSQIRLLLKLRSANTFSSVC